MIKLILVLVLLVCAVAPTFAWFVDGHYLVDKIDCFRVVTASKTGRGVSDLTYMKAQQFMGFVQAVADMATESGLLELPGETTVGEVLRAVAAYFARHEDRWDEAAVGIVRDALIERYGE